MGSHAFADGEPDLDVLRRMNAPENELPVSLPQNVVLARSADLAVAVVGLQVYTTGVAFQLVVRMRPAAQEALGRDLDELFWGHRSGAGRSFMFGVEFADGRRAGTYGHFGDGDVIFHQGSGSGGDASIEQNWWLSPVPPPGLLRLVVRCAELGIEETVVELDGEAVARAVDSVTTLWPWESPRHRDPEPPPPVELPAGSWFAGG